jgi:hypothetical protein
MLCKFGAEIQHFKTETEKVFQILDFNTKLIWLIFQEDFIAFSCHKNFALDLQYLFWFSQFSVEIY